MDKLLPLKLPPGMRNTGTTYQSRDRWYTGNLVRFFQDTIQPIGGWTKRTLTGATVTAGSFVSGKTYTILTVGTTNFVSIGASASTIGIVFTATGVGSGTGTATVTIGGTPSAAHTWTDSSGEVWLAVGTTNGLYAVKNSTNAVYDITSLTMAVWVPQANLVWSLDNFGGWLMCVAGTRVLASVLSSSGFPSVWKCNPATPAVQCDTVYTNNATLTGNFPYNMNALVSTPERFILMLCGFPLGSGMEGTYYAQG